MGMTDMLPAGTGKRLEGSELKGSRDALQEKILTDTTWCCYCCYAGCGMDGLDLPCFFCLGEVCCLRGTVKLTNCWDQDGCFSKCCCCVLDASIPAGYTPGFVCCGATLCCANMPEKTDGAAPEKTDGAAVEVVAEQ